MEGAGGSEGMHSQGRGEGAGSKEEMNERQR